MFFRAPTIRTWHWGIPLLMLLVSAPIWWGAWEPALFRALNQFFRSGSDHFWATLALLGTGWGLFGATAWCLRRSPRIVLAWLCAAPVAGVLTRVGKSFFFSPRPLELLGSEGIRVVGEPLFVAAMPSGHTMTAFAGAAAVYFSMAERGRRRHLWLFVLAAMVGVSRIAVGAHWPADVVVGASAGVFSGLVGAWVAQRLPAHWVRSSSWLMRAVAVFGLYCVYVLWTDEMGFAINMPLQWALGAWMLMCLLHFLVTSFKGSRHGFD